MNRNTIKNFILISLTSFIGNYVYFKNFGFYEDDYFYITPNIENYFGDVISMIGVRMTNWFYGHPLIFITDVLTYIGMRLGGLNGLYLMSFLVLTLNSWLVYMILKKIYSGSDIFAVSGAMMFCLFPANTAKIMLTFSFSLQIALTFLFIATLLYLSGKKQISYVVILGALFLYEPAFMVFWAVPLLKINSVRKKELVKHIFILLTMLIINLIIRYFMEGEKVLYIFKDVPRYLNETLSSLLDGPYSIILSFLRAPEFAIKNFSSGILLFAVLSFAIFMFAFYGRMKPGEKTETATAGDGTADLKLYPDLAKIFFVSLILIVIPYSLPLVYKSADVLTGKMTIVHTAASFGASILFASACMFLVSLSGKKNIKIFMTGLAGAYLSLLVCYNVLIQKDFVQSWENQREFWNKVRELCPDMTDRTLIFVIQNENNKLPQTKFIQSNSWTDPIILRQIFDFPYSWTTPPRLFVLNEDWEKRVFLNKDKLEWNVPVATWDPHTEVLPDSNLIILRPDNNNNLIREESPISIEGRIFNLRAKADRNERILKGGDLDIYFLEKNYAD